MGANEFYQNPLISIGYVDNQPVFIAANIKNNPVIGDKIDRRSEYILNVLRPVPHGFVDETKPSPERHFRLRMTPPKLSKCPFGDHLHEMKIAFFEPSVNAFSHNGKMHCLEQKIEKSFRMAFSVNGIGRYNR